MTVEYILRCAVSSMIRGHHSAHCFSAHVPNEGYVNNGNLQSTRADYLRQLERSATSEIENMDYASAYAEPGYTDPKRGILFANWNVLPRGLDSILERAGYAVEWSDEWTTCSDCGKAVRTSPDSYHYQPAYVTLNDCETICLDCVDWSNYLESIEDNSSLCCMARCNPEDFGYTRISESGAYENGFHRGQDDNPKTILKTLHAQGKRRIVFRLSETSQFYVRFETWQKIEDEEMTRL